MAKEPQPIRIVLADDHPILRGGLKVLLQEQPEFAVVGEAGDGLEALRAVERTLPDVLVVDITMPGLNGLDVARQIAQLSPTTRVIILSMHSTDAFVAEALRNGASAYIVKDSTLEDLVQAVRTVMAGKRFLSPSVSELLIDKYLASTSGEPIPAHERLTDREREVFQLVIEGHTSKEIGQRLFISPRTVEIHRGTMMKKLGIRNHIELLAYAVKRGILPA